MVVQEKDEAHFVSPGPGCGELIKKYLKSYVSAVSK